MAKDEREIKLGNESLKEKMLEACKEKGGDLETVPVSQFALPFAKTSPKWKEFEETEIFKRAPQRPHFGQMVRLVPPVELREEFALAAMSSFYKMSEKVYNIGKGQGDNYDYTDSFAYAEELLGFDVTALRSHINEVEKANASSKEPNKTPTKKRKASSDRMEKEMSDESSQEPKVLNTIIRIITLE